MSHAATVIASAAKKQNQYNNDQNQFHDKLQCAGFEWRIFENPVATTTALRRPNCQITWVSTSAMTTIAGTPINQRIIGIFASYAITWIAPIPSWMRDI
jgi:hypothetical protein